MTTPLSEIELLGRLVGFDTVSSRSNLELIDFVRSYLSGLGVASTLLPDATGQKANLFATIGPADVPGYVLSGHTDVVPVEVSSGRAIRSACGRMTAGSTDAARPT